MTQDKEPRTSALGEAMGALIILFLLLPLTALTMRATIEIITRSNCGGVTNVK